MPRLSVLMPVFNAEGTAALAIRSTLRAMPCDSELLVLDDASTDATARVLAGISDERLRVITLAKNSGVSYALQTLQCEVSSPYQARMDADDVCLPWRFAVQMRYLNRHADVDAVFGGAIRFKQRSLPRPSLPIRFGSSFACAMLPIKNPYIHPTMVARTSALETVGGYRNGPAEDYDLWLRLAYENRRIVRLGIPVIGYREHSGQVSQGKAYAKQTSEDLMLKQSFEKLAMQAYPGHAPGVLWEVLQRRITGSLDAPVSSQWLADGRDKKLQLTRLEAMYLDRWVTSNMGKS